MKSKQTYKNINTLVENVKIYNSKANISLIKKAYEFSSSAHRGQKREDGKQYITHPFEVAKILVDLRSDSSTLCAAILHDVLEETDLTYKDLKKEFGKEIAQIVEGLSKTTKVKFESKEHYIAENLRKILLATAKDIRIILIKLADRLHNMRTLSVFRDEKRRRISQETLDIYAPIADKLGIQKIKGELEDLSLRYLEPSVYNMLRNKIQEKREIRERRAKNIIKLIKQKLKEKRIESEIQGRAKYFYSIYKKMKRDHKTFNEIYDLMAIRILVKTVPECYAAMGMVHDLWHPMPKRVKDYIAVPKSNGYQSLHTSVITEKGKILEVQIRTEEMHLNAEDGIAAHWFYKGTERDKQFDKKISWLRHLLEWKSSDSPEEFIDNFKIDLFQDEVVVFTPQGDPITLPEGSTPVDFAYELHSSLGGTCSKAEVNNSIVPLDYKLKSGEVVNIISSKNSKPSRQWLKFVRTPKSKNLIRRSLGIKTFKKSNLNILKDLTKYIKSDSKYPLMIAKCCNPQLKNPIKGFLKKDKKIAVHSSSCENITSLKKEVNVKWNIKEKVSSNVTMVLKDKLGLISEILSTISKYNIPIISINSKQIKDRQKISFEINTIDKKIIQEILEEIKIITVLVSYEIK